MRMWNRGHTSKYQLTWKNQPEKKTAINEEERKRGRTSFLTELESGMP
jgi:hypothetical protein